MNLDDPSADFAPLGFLEERAEVERLGPGTEHSAGHLSGCKDFGKVRLQPAPC